jgi:hypothetical protein
LPKGPLQEVDLSVQEFDLSVREVLAFLLALVVEVFL